MGYRLSRGVALGLALLAAQSCVEPRTPAGSSLPAPVSAPSSAPDPAPPPREDGRLPGGVVPTDYRVDLTVDPRQKSFPGHVRIGVLIERPTRVIVMHARGISVHLASVEQAG